MSQINWLKYGGTALSVVGAVIGIASDAIAMKQMTNDLLKSKELQDLINKAVNEHLKTK
jgi:hypothetical protein